jgi:2-(1,2-epoxy-1,2-dihydrophenyl)acetyl-CoA isomerase
MSEGIVTARDEGLLTIAFHRPQALNAFTREMGVELLDALRAGAEDPAVRAITLTGNGRAFSSGADLRAPRKLTSDGRPDLSSNLREVYNPALLTIRDAQKPVIAAVNGPAAGIGAAFALACDLIVAAESAYFLLAFVDVGLIPDGGAAYLLASRVGYGRAAQLAMLGSRLPAQQALEWGVVNEIWPDDEFQERATEFARRLAMGPTVALANMKRAMRAGAHAGLEQQLALEATLQQANAVTHDYAEGVQAFKEKRRPQFEGR